MKKENEQLIQAGRKLQEQLATIQHEYNVSHELIIDTNNEEEVLYLRQQINDLEKKYQQLKNDTHIHNARGAGRKPSKERLHSIDQVKNLLDSGCSDQDIMNLLKISRATFYRYKRSINN